MQRPTLSSLALAAALALCVACGGSQKHAESPDPAESGWSGASSDGAQAKADPPIQAPAASGDSAAAAKSAPSAGDKADKQVGPPPQTSSAAEADVVSGNSLPPSLRAGGAPSTDASATPSSGSGRKPAKAKRPGKRRKKSAG